MRLPALTHAALLALAVMPAVAVAVPATPRPSSRAPLLLQEQQQRSSPSPQPRDALQDIFSGALADAVDDFKAALGDLGQYVGSYVQHALGDPMREVGKAFSHTSSLSQVESLPEGGVKYGEVQTEGGAGTADETKPPPPPPQKALVQFELNAPPRFLPDDSTFESATIDLFTRSFANSYFKPEIFAYSPSLLPASFQDPTRWVSLALRQVGKSRGRQFDRLGSLYLGNPTVGDGVEIWRTGNPQPINTTLGTNWTLTRDVSRYYSLFATDGRMLFEYPNIVDEMYTAPINITLSLTVHQRKADAPPYVPSGGTTPGRRQTDEATQEKWVAGRIPLHLNAPLVYPISKQNGTGDSKWALPEDKAAASLTIPRNARRALVEVYASGTADDEFWYGHVNDFLVGKVPGGPDLLPVHGPYREVQLFIDGVPAGITYPFPVIFTGGYLPFLWKPLASHGALDQPTYLFDVSAFLGLLCDGQAHEFRLGVRSAEEGGDVPNSFWLSGNLQVELDEAEGVTTGEKPTVEEDNAGEAWERTGEIHGDPQKDDGWLTSIVRNADSAPERVLSLRGSIQSPSDSAPREMKTTHRITYASTQNLSHALNVADLAGGGLTVQSSTHGGAPFLATRGSFPHGSFVVNDTRAFYNVSLELDYVYEQTFLGGLAERGALTGFAQPVQLGVKAHVEGRASAFLDPKQFLAIVDGIGATNVSYTYTDSDSYAFSRRTNVFNRTITFDEVAGNLAPYGDPIR